MFHKREFLGKFCCFLLFLVQVGLNRHLYNSAWNGFENLGRLRSSEERGDHSTELNSQNHGECYCK